LATSVVNKHHGVPAGSVYIGRGSPWGNPFSHREGTKAQFVVASREEAIQAYADWLQGQPDLLARLPQLRDKTLVCFCRPAKGFQGRLMCHGQVLAGLVDGVDPESID
jgi:hypothetical protein